MDIRPLTGIGHDEIFAAWNDAFDGYARTWGQTELANDLQRRGYMPSLSFGAFENGRLVGFTLNGVGMHNGIKTAYDTGTGTIKSHRGRGLATQIFNASLPVLQQAAIQQYMLEVLLQNEPAIAIYKNVGFRISREFSYNIQNTEGLGLMKKEMPARYQIRETTLAGHAMAEMWDFTPSWQNSFDSMLRTPEDIKVVGAFIEGDLVGYGIISPASGDIPQLAVSMAHRRQGIGSHLLKRLLAYNKSSVVKAINIDNACNHMAAFLENNGIPKTGAQYEMVRPLSF
jgi:ribosomal protein S18 acetylase RimI-like enzyme